jgi:hypothetical protein
MPQYALRSDQLCTKAASLILPQMALRLFGIKFLPPERTYSSLQIGKFPYWGIIDSSRGELIFATGVPKSLGEPRGGAPISLLTYFKNLTALIECFLNLSAL